MPAHRMQLKQLQLQNFRNYTHLVMEPCAGINVLAGKNAQGKTNLLEAVYLLATTRSFRGSRDAEAIRHGAESAQIRAEVAKENSPDVTLELILLPTDTKRVRINGSARPRVLELLGNLNAVTFFGQDLAIVSGEPSDRRRFLNVEISQMSPRYLHEFAQYKKALEQRNRILRDLPERPELASVLEAWNDQLVQHGAPLIQKRRFFIQQLAPIARRIHAELTEDGEILEVKYLSGIAADGDEAQIRQAFREELRRTALAERHRGQTLTGPQRDDLAITINGWDARQYASNGQQRTATLSLKLAQFQMMREALKEAPVVLLDDVLSELDEKRRLHLMDWVMRRCQVFLTCTSTDALPGDVVADAAIWQVEAGEVHLCCRHQSE
ncbi:MAG: DNA replication/repair protein RecF [Chthonomonadales bacterium]